MSIILVDIKRFSTFASLKRKNTKDGKSQGNKKRRTSGSKT